jgi:hypothetical protein
VDALNATGKTTDVPTRDMRQKDTMDNLACGSDERMESCDRCIAPTGKAQPRNSKM